MRHIAGLEVNLEISKITGNAYLVFGESDLEAPAASWNCSAHGRSRSVARSLDHGERLVVGRPVAKDGNRWIKKKSRPIALVFLYLFCPFSYLQKKHGNGMGSRKGCIPPVFVGSIFIMDDSV